MFPREDSKRRCSGGCVSRALRSTPRLPRSAERSGVGAFTLFELLIVIAIIAVLLVLIAPAFTSLKSAGDFTSAAYTIKGALDAARTYAKANNTYTWLGFYEENVVNPSSPNADQPPVGRLIMSIVASKDGTNVYGSGNGIIDPTKLVQIGKLMKIEMFDTLDAVLRGGSLAAAASETNLTASAVSMQMKQIEAYLGQSAGATKDGPP